MLLSIIALCVEESWCKMTDKVHNCYTCKDFMTCKDKRKQKIKYNCYELECYRTTLDGKG